MTRRAAAGSVGVMELVNDNLAVFTAESGRTVQFKPLGLGCRMETVRLVHGGSSIMSPLIPSIFGLAVLVLAACSAAAPSATPQIPSTQASSEEGAPP